jgi:hypothetical protein
VKQEVLSHFENQFKEEAFNKPLIYGLNFIKQLSNADNLVLTASFSMEEIKEAI